jgi:hypothetical protein
MFLGFKDPGSVDYVTTQYCWAGLTNGDRVPSHTRLSWVGSCFILYVELLSMFSGFKVIRSRRRSGDTLKLALECDV